jgi:hypothetical protein
MRRVALAAAGWLCVVLGLIGLLLPLVPTTPFLLLAAACFLRSSPAMHARLLAHPQFGPYLEQWRRDHSVPPAAKRRAYLLVVAGFAVSMALVEGWLLRLILVLFNLGLLFFLSRLRTGPPVKREKAPPPD